MSDRTDFLYPFLEENERDAASLLADLGRSAREKASVSAALRGATLDRAEEQVRLIATQMAERFTGGGRLFTFGNGGSATDAAGVAALFSRPPHGSPLPARSLVADEAVLTALSNDIGFEVVFSRQLIAYGQPRDMAMGISTSGNSENVIRAFGEARARGMLTVGLAGYDGGTMGMCDDLDHCVVVQSDSVHRIQEAQSTLAYALWAQVQHALGDVS